MTRLKSETPFLLYQHPQSYFNVVREAVVSKAAAGGHSNATDGCRDHVTHHRHHHQLRRAVCTSYTSEYWRTSEPLEANVFLTNARSGYIKSRGCTESIQPPPSDVSIKDHRSIFSHFFRFGGFRVCLLCFSRWKRYLQPFLRRAVF